MSLALDAEPSAESRVATRSATRVWITWEKQRRNATISEALGCRLVEFDLHYPSIIRYPLALALTLRTFVRERPSLIFAQNPSMILAAFAAAYGRLRRIPVIVDAHNAGVEPLHRKPRWQAALARFILRRSTLTILSNEALAHRVRLERGIAPITALPDPIPLLKRPPGSPALLGKKNVLYICSWAEDEPYLEVIQAARLLPADTYIYITGRSGNRLTGLPDQLPRNVVLTGYVDEETFLGLLFKCDVILDLTTWEDCLLCGGYEAVSAERPMILSGTTALRSYFRDGALYTDNTPQDLSERIREALVSQASLTERVRKQKAELVRQWERDKAKLEDTLSQLVAARG